MRTLPKELELNPSKKLAAINFIRERTGCMQMGRVDEYWVEFVSAVENPFEQMGEAHWLLWLKNKLGGQHNGNDRKSNQGCE